MAFTTRRVIENPARLGQVMQYINTNYGPSHPSGGHKKISFDWQHFCKEEQRRISKVHIEFKNGGGQTLSIAGILEELGV